MELTGLEGLGPAPSQYSFYNGEVTIYFDESLHEYTRFDAMNGLVIVRGVTSAVHIIDKSDALTQWAANMTTDYIREKLTATEQEARTLLPHLFADGTPFTLEASTVESWLNDARFNFSKYKKAAADTGKLAHEWIEHFIRALMSENWDQVLELQQNLPEDPRAYSGVVAALDFMAQHKVRWVMTEEKIYSREYDYAGTCDGLAYVSSCANPECCGYTDPNTGERVALVFSDVLTVIDWKTSNRLYEEYEYQTAAYLEAIHEMTGMRAQFRFITRLGKEDAKFEARLLREDTQFRDMKIFLQCLDLYRSVEERKDADRSVRETIKLVLKAKKEADVAAEKAAKAAAREAARAERMARDEAAKLAYKSLRAQGMTKADAERIAYPWKFEVEEVAA